MYTKFFNGYNCYSAAIGEYANQKNIKEIDKIILSQRTFMFNKDCFWNNDWFAGSTLTPVDSYLEKDLEDFCNVKITEYSSTAADNIEKTKNCLEKNKLQIVLVDFYCLESVNWEVLKRFNILPEHDPHFIIVTGMDSDSLKIIDPYYNYQGEISIEKFQIARESDTRQGKLHFKSYEPYLTDLKYVDLKKIVKFRFERFLYEKMYYKVEEMGVEFDKRRLIEGKNQNREWALSGYNCLRSTMDQHANINKLARMYDINIPLGSIELENQWGLIRKKLLEFYNYRLDDLEEISYLVLKTAVMEKKYAKKVLDSSL